MAKCLSCCYLERKQIGVDRMVRTVLKDNLEALKGEAGHRAVLHSLAESFLHSRDIFPGHPASLDFIHKGQTRNIVIGRHKLNGNIRELTPCLLYTSPSPRDGLLSRMPSSA